MFSSNLSIFGNLDGLESKSKIVEYWVACDNTLDNEE